MGYATKDLHNHLVYYDSDNPHRWLDVIGPSVVKHIFDGVELHRDLYTLTIDAGGSIAQADSTLGGQVVFTTDNDDTDTAQAQLLGEAFYLSGVAHPCYFGARFKIDTVATGGAFLGLAVQDTSIIAGCADNIGFKTEKDSAALLFVLENTNVETTASVATLADDTYIVAEFYYDGLFVTYYINGIEVGSYATSEANMPDDEHLSPALAATTGASAVRVMTVDWARWFQIQA